MKVAVLGTICFERRLRVVPHFICVDRVGGVRHCLLNMSVDGWLPILLDIPSEYINVNEILSSKSYALSK